MTEPATNTSRLLYADLIEVSLLDLTGCGRAGLVAGARQLGQ